MESNSAIKSGVAAVALIAAVSIYYMTRPAERMPDEFKTYCVDLETREPRWVEYEADDQIPYFNSDTGTATLYPLYYSHDAQRGFVPPLTPTGRLPKAFACPITGSTNIELYDPEVHDTLATGPIWLPGDPLK